MTDLCQLAMVKLPHPLNPPSCEVYPRFSEPGGLRKEGRKGVFHVVCPSSGEAHAEDNCTNKECGIDDGNGSLCKCNSIACSNEDHLVRDVQGKCGVSILSVAATERVTGNERKGYYNTIQNAKTQATNPGEKEFSSQLVLQNINEEDSLSLRKKNCQPSYLNTKLILPKKKNREMQLL